MKLLVLGSGQDAGVPQINCECINCVAARKNPKQRRLGPSIALINEEKRYAYLIDASPDIKQQIDILNEFTSKNGKQEPIPLEGIFLTHAHFGHCSGLWSLGKECWDVKEMKVFCSPKMGEFLKTHHPFKHLLERKNVVLKTIEPEVKLKIKDFNIRPIKVPHRNEYADTVGYILSFNKMVAYIPDFDTWTKNLVKEVKKVDIALIDGSFYQHGELPRMAEVPHPPMEETMHLLKDPDSEIYFTHFNHTNPVLQKDSKEYDKIIENDFALTEDGLVIDF